MKILFRYRLWKWFISNISPGQILPVWLLIIRAILFPVDFLKWKLCVRNCYDFERDIFVIYGVKYSPKFFMEISKSDGASYKITNQDGVLIAERIV